MLTADAAAALDGLEQYAQTINAAVPTKAASIRWLCVDYRKLASLDAPLDDRIKELDKVIEEQAKVLQTQAARIVELESRQGLTPDRVLALEREQLRGRMEAIADEAEAAARAGRRPRPVDGSRTPSLRELREAARASEDAR